MQREEAEQALRARITQLNEHLAAIRRKMETVIADNRRLREVVRLAEGELRKRRDQVQQLEQELQSLQHRKLEARARVEHAMNQLDKLIARGEERP
ncbi:MAG: hypothetical protein D6678_07880 [Zetaproteobacteria bacterium]|nr:MAG: hypothetical protein D6678_07880 [Zetaproteobacteria bacterium]